MLSAYTETRSSDSQGERNLSSPLLLCGTGRCIIICTHIRWQSCMCVCLCVRTHTSFCCSFELAISHLNFTLSVLSPRVPSEGKSSPQKLNRAFALSLATSYKQKLLCAQPIHLLKYGEIKTGSRWSVLLFCSFIPMRYWKNREREKKWQQQPIKEVVATVCLLTVCTHRLALTHSFICTFTLFHDSSFMHGPVLL